MGIESRNYSVSQQQSVSMQNIYSSKTFLKLYVCFSDFLLHLLDLFVFFACGHELWGGSGGVNQCNHRLMVHSLILCSLKAGAGLRLTEL